MWNQNYQMPCLPANKKIKKESLFHMEEAL